MVTVIDTEMDLISSLFFGSSHKEDGFVRGAGLTQFKSSARFHGVQQLFPHSHVIKVLR